jgi:hypothetical protein
MGRKKKSLPDDEYELTGQLRHILRKPKLNEDLTGPTNFIIKCGNFKWLVHQEPITQESVFFKMMTESKFRVSTTNPISNEAGLTSLRRKRVSMLSIFQKTNQNLLHA